MENSKINIQDVQTVLIKANVISVEKQAFLVKDLVKDSIKLTKFLGFAPAVCIENGILCAKVKGFKKFTAGCVLVKSGGNITEVFTNLSDFNVRYSTIGKLELETKSEAIESPDQEKTEPKK